jgi:hypothetical protein
MVMVKASRVAVPLAVLAAAFVMTACAQTSAGQAGPVDVSLSGSGSDGSDGVAVDGESVTVNGQDGEDGGTSVGQSSSSSGSSGSGSADEVTTEEISGVGRLEVSTATGQVRVTGTDATSVTVTRSIYRGGAEPEETVRHEGDLLHIESGCTSSTGPCRIDYEVAVPRGVAVTIEAASGDLFTSGLTGSQSVSSVSGSVVLSDVQGQQTAAESTSGDVEVRLLNPPGRLDASSVSGDVTVLVPDSGPYRVVGSTVTGDAEIGVRTDPAAAATISVTTTSGDITVGTG